MITKAIIEKIVSNRSYQVRIPIFDKVQSASLSNNSLQTAYVSSQLNNGMNLSIGDIVFVDFEDNSYFNPVIVGILYSQDNTKSIPDVEFNSLKVSNNAAFSKDTYMGDSITYENIVCLKNSEKNIQLQLDELLNSLEEYRDKLSEQIKAISDNSQHIESAKKESDSIDTNILVMRSIFGNSSDKTEETLYGKLNSLSKRIDTVLSSVGTIDENTTFFERLQNINSRLEKLMKSSPVVSVGDGKSYEQTIAERETSTVTENEYSPSQSDRFDSLLSLLKKKFPHGKYWNHMPYKGTGKEYNNQDGWTNIPCTKHNHYCGTKEQTCNGYAPNGAETSWQCMGYANKCGFDMTGHDPEKSSEWKKTTNVNDLKYLKKGDIIRYKNDGHSIYVTGVSGNYVTYTDCNSDGHCGIKWESVISKSDISSSFSYIRVSPTDLSMSKLYN